MHIQWGTSSRTAIRGIPQIAGSAWRLFELRKYSRAFRINVFCTSLARSARTFPKLFLLASRAARAAAPGSAPGELRTPMTPGLWYRRRLRKFEDLFVESSNDETSESTESNVCGNESDYFCIRIDNLGNEPQDVGKIRGVILDNLLDLPGLENRENPAYSASFSGTPTRESHCGCVLTAESFSCELTRMC